MLKRVIFALEAGVFGFLLLRPAEGEQDRPEKDQADGHNPFVVVRGLVKPAAELVNADADSLYLSRYLFAVIPLVLQGRDVGRREILR